ncbi:hypothetical protein [Hyphomonas sp.]|uniref:hypothetical protein n=1 Tax=Hyphomonas sp. TaxID=87 RepID=UPI00391C1B86
MRTIRHLISWVLALILIFLCLQMTLHPLPDPPLGVVKLYDIPGENAVFSTLAARTGLSLFEPAGRFIAAVMELLAALLLIVPASRRLGAGILAVMSGAGIGLHLSPWLGTELMLPGGVTDSGMQFLMTIVLFALSVLLLVLHPGGRRAR